MEPDLASEQAMPAVMGSTVNQKMESPMPAMGPKRPLRTPWMSLRSVPFSSIARTMPWSSVAMCGSVFMNSML